MITAIRTFAAFAAGILSLTIAFAEPLRLDIRGAEAGYDERTGKPILKVTLTDTARDAWRRFTSQNVGRRIELRIDGDHNVLATVVREPILGASFHTTVATADEARALAGRLSKGGVRVEVETVADPN